MRKTRSSSAAAEMLFRNVSAWQEKIFQRQIERIERRVGACDVVFPTMWPLDARALSLSRKMELPFSI